MTIMVGGTRVQDIRIGDTGVTAVYVGSQRVWSKTSIYFNFEGPATTDLTPLGFVHHTTSVYKLCQSGDGGCRVNMPDGFSTLGLFTDWARYASAVAPSDDGYLEFGFKSLGDESPLTENYQTMILARGINTSNTFGVGVLAELGEIGIASRIGSVNALRVPCGSFDTNDKFRLRISNRIFTLYRNGEFAGEWNDATSATGKSAGHRSLLLSGIGGRHFLSPRYFSPEIDYVEYG